jgi:FKBP-type peptidyl-prolyl cis-trans isomerase
MDDVQVEIFTAGDGINYPKPGQTVTVHYCGYVSCRLFL